MHNADHNPAHRTRFLPSEADTLALGNALAAALEPGTVIYLSGDLGTGKTTLARGLIRGLGYPGKVRSPTFTLVELYKFSKLYLYHFDFYRFGDPREWADAGFREYVTPESVCLVEWPEKAAGRLPEADVRIALSVEADGRRAKIEANTEAGRRCIARLGG
ncbi:MAG TPA: tRNA (adenosine(37)-N6)-threonylcarbamoyltransferase complex ATPase subunit type 1 TsaE [Burkholderiales bacterium]|nr:tRNA (adenosine(37)-N6)-threonylcarbamoyltransferase complex ATPase subunit type 1 TsaE [Burkholderiales bacterium]